MLRITVLAILVGALAGPMSPPAGAEEPGKGDIQALLELGQRFYYAGDPFPIRISIGNEGDKKVANPVKTQLFAGFEIRDGGGRVIEPSGEPGVVEPSRPDKLAPSSFYGSVVDLTRIYPELLRVGTFEVRWAADGVESETIVVKMIPKYDPAKSYTARVMTGEGPITIELLTGTAPLAVKNFIDLSHAGFYDGSTIHDIRPETFVVGGKPAPYTYPAELSRLPVVAGTVLMKPVSPSPPANGAEFIIALRPEPGWTGQFTVVGQVVDGLEVVRKISRLPSSGASANPPFKPLRDIPIRNVTITEKPDNPPRP